jgi:hypothetical protein
MCWVVQLADKPKANEYYTRLCSSADEAARQT